MALLPTLLALGIGTWLGMRWGGSFANIARWHPELPQLGLAGLTLMIVTDVVGPGGSLGVILRILALGLVAAFAFLNIRTGGMILVAVGFSMNLLVTLLHWGMPVATGALVASGIANDPAAAESIVLEGGRKVADGALLGFLGDVIPLPWGQVLSLGDLLWLGGLALVMASVLRRYEVGVGPRRGGSGGRRARVGGYTSSLSALGKGPAPRRGPGLHPSRLGERRSR